MAKRTFKFKKGILYDIDKTSEPQQFIGHVMRKPETREEIESMGGTFVNERDIGDFSEYDIFNKSVTITIEIED